MTPGELAALRDRVARAQLAHEPRKPTAKEAAGQAALRAMKLAGKCAYCGVDVSAQKRRTGKPLTCRAHSDLPARDPNYEGLA